MKSEIKLKTNSPTSDWLCVYKCDINKYTHHAFSGYFVSQIGRFEQTLLRV